MRLRNAISPATLINLIILALAWFTGFAKNAQHWLIQREGHEFPIRLWAIFPPAFAASIVVLGIIQWIATPRAARSLARMIEHAAIAFVGGSFVLICQTLMPKFWLVPAIAMIFVATMLNRILFGDPVRITPAVLLAAGLVVADFLLPASWAATTATPAYLVWLAMIITIWSAIVRIDPQLSWWTCGLEPQIHSQPVIQSGAPRRI
ncbi:MAG: hypothetical protein H7Z14_16430 [Anaerolineae bacterium]|nr:hypothetical protein [Phycisphaerae bacterium]